MGKGRPPVRRAPPDKKALSYAKDRRNSYGENDKASRKAIPQRKATESRRVRRETKQALDQTPKLAEEAADVVESSARLDLGRVGGWKKAPDQPLGDHLVRQSLRAARRAKSPSSDT